MYAPEEGTHISCSRARDKHDLRSDVEGANDLHKEWF